MATKRGKTVAGRRGKKVASKKSTRVAPAETLPDRLLRIVRERGPLAAWAEETERRLEEPVFQRDPEFLKVLLFLMEGLNRYFDAEVRGFQNVPAKGPMLLVGNHSGAMLTPDTTAFITHWYRKRGLGSPLVGLAFDAAFAVPGMRTIMRKIGQVPASRANAGRALDAGAAVVVYPGGDHEVFRPWTDRNKIDFNGRKGFIKLALEKQVPVIPVVGHGGHDSTIVLARGDQMAERLGLDALRLSVFPILWQIPWGVSVPGMPSLPLPAKVTLKVLKPMDWSAYGPADAKNPEVLQHCYDEITGVMQKTLDRLAKKRPYPVLSRLWDLVPGKPATKPARAKRAAARKRSSASRSKSTRSP